MATENDLLLLLTGIFFPRLCFLGNRLLRQLDGDKLCQKAKFNPATNLTDVSKILYVSHSLNSIYRLLRLELYFQPHYMCT